MCKVNSSLYYVQKTATTGKQSASGQTHWIPNTDVYATEGQLVIKVELAGMRREDLELTVEGNRLMVSGQRPDGGRGSKCKFLVMEINYGSFECVIDRSIRPAPTLSAQAAVRPERLTPGFGRPRISISRHVK